MRPRRLNGPDVRQNSLPDDSGMIPEGLTGIIVGQTKTRQPDGLAGLFWLREGAADDPGARMPQKQKPPRQDRRRHRKYRWLRGLATHDFCGWSRAWSRGLWRRIGKRGVQGAFGVLPALVPEKARKPSRAHGPHLRATQPPHITTTSVRFSMAAADNRAISVAAFRRAQNYPRGCRYLKRNSNVCHW